jgi:hypothetical protein
MREIIVAVMYVAVEVIHFLVVAKRDAKSVTIPDETGRRLPHRVHRPTSCNASRKARLSSKYPI